MNSDSRTLLQILLVLVGIALLYWFLFSQQAQHDRTDLMKKIDLLGMEIAQLLDVPPQVWVSWRESLQSKPLTIPEMKEYINRLQAKLIDIKIQRGMM